MHVFNRTLCTAALLALSTGAAWSQVQVTATNPSNVRRGGTPAATAPEFKLATMKPPTDLSATPITLHYTSTTESDVMADIAAQVGFTFDATPPQNQSPYYFKLVTINADKQPYWNVITALTDAAGANGNMSRHPDGALGPRSAGYTEFRSISGPFLVSALAVKHAARFDAMPDRLDDCVVSIQLQAEPHIAVRQFKSMSMLGTAVDENGISLLAPADAFAPGDYQAINRDAVMNLFEARLRPPASAGHKIARLAGTLQVKIVSEYATIEIPDIATAKPSTAKAGDVDLNIGALTRTSLNITIPGVGFTQPRLGDMDRLISSGEYRLYDANGQVAPGTAAGTSMAGTNRVYSISFSPVTSGPKKFGTPAKAVLLIPTAFLEVPITFDFKDLPLP